MQCETLVDQYVQRLQAGFVCTPLEDGYLLTTPYLRPDNDAIEVFVSPVANGRYLISDRGETLFYLSSFGHDFMDSRQRALRVQRIARAAGVEVLQDEVQVTVSEENLPAAFERVAQVLRELSGLSHILRPAIRPTFREQVRTFLSSQRIPIEENRELEGASGPWRVDFYVNSQANSAIEAMTAGTSSYAQHQINATIVKLLDLRQVDPKLGAVALLDDEEGRGHVWPGRELLMLQRQAQIIFWSRRQDLTQALPQADTLGGSP